MTTTTIWVVRNYLGAVRPYVEQYEAIRVGEKSATVLVRAGKKVVHVCAGQKIFTDREVLASHLKEWVTRSIGTLKNRVAELEVILKEGIPVEVVPAHRTEVDKDVIL